MVQLMLKMRLLTLQEFFKISCQCSLILKTPRNVKEVKSSEPEFNRNLLKRVEELELSVRSMNCLKNDNIIYIGIWFKKLNQRCLEHQTLVENLNEIKEVLNTMSLYLGMEIPNWPPDNIAELSKKLDENNY